MSGELPPVAELEASDDRDWFAEHPGRRYRMRPGDGGTWLIRQKSRALLRTFAREPLRLPDTDEALAVAWQTAAYPDTIGARPRPRARRRESAQ
jgi:hypothetical protein